MKRGLLGKILKWTAITIAVLLVAFQFIRPARTNPPVDESRTISANGHLTPEVAAVLDRSCNDCHSNRTRWPWYSNIAPVSWFVVGHVNEGRREMNFSDWAGYSPEDRQGYLKKMCREVERGDMPLKSYLRLHSEANLSSEDVKLLCDWANAESQRVSQALK
ncbi:MAG TPA: heme-binding domain-containing protein [Pyrinomonadaceae bacterium]|nr:heme-binding domain-containing protein [Pyrinomonadaceae bacterium]